MKRKKRERLRWRGAWYNVFGECEAEDLESFMGTACLPCVPFGRASQQPTRMKNAASFS